MTFKLNLAFLYAYSGDLKGASRQYKSAADLPVNPNVMSEIEEFMCWFLELEPEKYQIHYCLGLYNWKIKNDLTQAIHDFEHFLSLGNTYEFKTERRLTEKWLKTLKIQRRN